jgi:uncharacterized membrane protein
VDPLAAALVACAAVLHVAWNLLLKTAGDPLRTAAVGVAVAAVALVPIAVFAWLLEGGRPIPPEALAVGVVSGGVEVVYFVLLSAAYRRGDLSLVYPLARGTAPLFAVAAGVVILGEHLAPAGVAGVALLLAGLLAVQRPWRLLGRAAAADRPAAGFALLTGLAIATYSALDRVGVQFVHPLVYAAILWVTCALGLGVWVGILGRRPGVGASRARIDVRRGAAAGVLTVVAYGFVLVALSRAPLAAVAPLRESAIVLATLVGVVGLREAARRREAAWRLGGAALIVAGAVFLAAGG